jgi:SAM-dependent methyltransferase
MLGAGHTKPIRKLHPPTSSPDDEIEWVTLDFNVKANPDYFFDLGHLHLHQPLPFQDEEFDEIHAYDVLEHVGQQGNFRGFFAEFKEYWRVLRPAGWLIGACPTEKNWQWDDPGHTRYISERTLAFLTRTPYVNLGSSPASDYREYVEPCWWRLLHSERVRWKDDDGGEHDKYYFGLKKD